MLLILLIDSVKSIKFSDTGGGRCRNDAELMSIQSHADKWPYGIAPMLR